MGKSLSQAMRCASWNILLNYSPRSLLSQSSLPVLPLSSRLAVKRIFAPARWINFGAFASLVNRVMATEQEPSSKKKCMRIGTHNGKFHCDEVLACYMLKLLPEYSDAEIVRTRNPKVLESCDIVVDVGGVYDPSVHRYDHHQRPFEGTMHSLTDGRKAWYTKLSSAGLVYLHFGERVIAQLLSLPQEDNAVQVIYDKMYSNFLEEIDAVDNGIDVAEGDLRYKITTTLSNRVGRLNPAWNEEGVEEDERFSKAMETAGGEFSQAVKGYHKVWLPARDIVKEALDRRNEVHSSGEILLLTQFCPWIEHLFMLEEEEGVKDLVKYVVYSDNKGGTWRVQAVPIGSGSFTNRLPLPEPWRGLRDDVLSKKCGVDNCVFVHASGFIGGNTTKEGSLEMAVKALDFKGPQQ